MENTTPASATSTQTTTTIGDASAALALADSSLATPVEESTPASTTEAAPIAQTQTETPTPESVSTEPSQKGEPPKWRWQDILENARTTTAKETEARVRQEIEQQLGWAKDIAAHERDGLMTWRLAMNGDPQALAHIRANPQAMSWLKGLVSEPQQSAADPEPEPDFVLPVRDAQGNVVGEKPIYSAETQAKREAWLKRQWLAEVKKEIAPLQQTAQTFQQREQQAAFTTNVTSVLAKMKAADPVFEKHMTDVAQTLQGDAKLLAMALGDDHRAPDPETALELAWSRVYRTKVQPAQNAQKEGEVLANLQRQAVAATTNPAAASSAAPKQTLGDARAALAHATALLGG